MELGEKGKFGVALDWHKRKLLGSKQLLKLNFHSLR